VVALFGLQAITPTALKLKKYKDNFLKFLHFKSFGFNPEKGSLVNFLRSELRNEASHSIATFSV
jgi:hypothetical protein